MAVGSQRYSLYYGLMTIFFLGVSIWCFVIVSRVSKNCQPECPLSLAGYIAPNGENRSYELCSCPEPASASDACDADCQRWTSAHNVWLGGQQVCYICGLGDNDLDVMQPCAVQSGGSWASAKKQCALDPVGFKPGNPLGGDTCAGGIDATFLTDGTIRARSFVNTGLYAIACFYLVQAACTFICYIGFQSFAFKESDDWLKLSRRERLLGVACKWAPPFVRVTNFFVAFFVALGGLFMFHLDVCYNDRNEYGEREFYPQASDFIGVTIVIWLLTFVFGSLFNAWVPRDTAFYAPRFPTDANDPAWYQCCSRGCYECQRWGP